MRLTFHLSLIDLTLVEAIIDTLAQMIGLQALLRLNICRGYCTLHL